MVVILVGWWILDALSKCYFASLCGIDGGVLKNLYVSSMFMYCSLFCFVFVLGLFDLRFD
jgi:hypothetical protein